MTELSHENTAKVRATVTRLLDFFEKSDESPELALLALLQCAVLIAVRTGVSQRVLFRTVMAIANHRAARVKARDY